MRGDRAGVETAGRTHPRVGVRAGDGQAARSGYQRREERPAAVLNCGAFRVDNGNLYY